MHTGEGGNGVLPVVASAAALTQIPSVADTVNLNTRLTCIGALPLAARLVALRTLIPAVKPRQRSPRSDIDNLGKRARYRERSELRSASQSFARELANNALRSARDARHCQIARGRSAQVGGPTAAGGFSAYRQARQPPAARGRRRCAHAVLHPATHVIRLFGGLRNLRPAFRALALAPQLVEPRERGGTIEPLLDQIAADDQSGATNAGPAVQIQRASEQQR